MSDLSYSVYFELEKSRVKNEKRLIEVNKSLEEKEEILESLSFFTKTVNKFAATKGEVSRKVLPMEKLMKKLEIVDIEELEKEVERLKMKKKRLENQHNRKSFKEVVLELLSTKFKRLFFTCQTDNRGKISTLSVDTASLKEGLILEVFWYVANYERLQVGGKICKDKYEESFVSLNLGFTKSNELTYEKFTEKYNLLINDLTDFVNQKNGNSNYYYEDERGKEYLIELSLFKLKSFKEVFSELTQEEFAEIMEDIYNDLRKYSKITW